MKLPRIGAWIGMAMILAATGAQAMAAETENGRETVVILHGIARTGASMAPMDRALRAAGYETVVVTYPSQKQDLQGIAATLRAGALSEEFWRSVGRVHFVTHSMGGLVARRYLADYRDAVPAEKLGRVVMLAPPNGGSEVADLLHRLPPYRWYYGPAGQELTTAARRRDAVPPHYETGIIAGTKEWTYIVAAFVVPGPSDGRVSIENTKWEGMKDHIALPATHTFIMDSAAAQRQAVHFIREGKFDHAGKSVYAP